jgi:hypothetical protein
VSSAAIGLGIVAGYRWIRHNPTLGLCWDTCFEESGNLPPGIHEASWHEFAERFGTTPRRWDLLDGLRGALDSLRRAGCHRAHIDGSVVTAMEHPSDFDACREESNVDPVLLDPTLLDFSDRRCAQKSRFGGEPFPATTPAGVGDVDFVDFFQHDPNTRQPKGIIAINLEDLS